MFDLTRRRMARKTEYNNVSADNKAMVLQPDQYPNAHK